MANMEDSVDEMACQDIWDDSALVNSWNEALAEYKKYHSIHATARSLVDDRPLLSENEQRAKPETQLDQHAQCAPRSIAGEADGPSALGQGTSAATATNGAATIKDRLDNNGIDEMVKDRATRGAMEENHGRVHANASIMPPPQALLGSVQDADLKRLLMSWYYAGFYTGLYEGQQKHRN